MAWYLVPFAQERPIRGACLAATLILVLIGGLLLCTCEAQPQPEATPPSTPTPARTALPTSAPELALAGTSLPVPTAVADVEIEVPDSVQLSQSETTIYTLTLRNHGPDVATSIVLTDVLPIGVTARWAEPAHAACRQIDAGVDCDLGALTANHAATVTLDLSGTGVEPVLTGARGNSGGQNMPWLTCAADQAAAPHRVTCLLGTLQPRSQVQVRVGLDAASPLTSTLVHTATVTAKEADPAPENNVGTSTLVPGPARPPEADLLAAMPDLLVQGDGPTSVTTGQPFTYTYQIANRGASDATRVWFVDEIPSDTNLVAYAPQLPRCEQQGDALTCQLQAFGRSESVTFTLEVTGHGGQALVLELDPLLPGWPTCFVIKEQTWQHIVYCEIGVLGPGQSTRIELGMVAIGSQPRTTANTATVHLAEQDRNPLDNTSTTTITIHAGGED